MTDDPTVFEWAGGAAALLRMTEIFYGRHVPADPLLAPLFAQMAPDHPERVAAWLGEVLGGPPAYSTTYGGYPQMISQHLGRNLTEEQRARWVALLRQSALEAGLPNDPEFRAAFVSYLEWGSGLAVENSQTGAQPPRQMPMPHWSWVHDATPGSRPSGHNQPPVVLDTGDRPGFAAHIQPLFRASDRQSMHWAFDLWSYPEVVEHAEAILDRLRAGSMPCDGAWPAAQVDVFARWIEAGKLE